jgi:hypothetical protein
MAAGQNLRWLAGAIAVVGAAALAYTALVPNEAAKRRLLPMPLAEVSALEIVIEGQLHRFDRDAGRAWYYHRHKNPNAEESPEQHVADPDMAATIAAALDSFSRATIERTVAVGAPGEAYGVTRPQVIVTLYVAGEARPAIQLMIGDPVPGEANRYLLIQDYATIVTIPERYVTDLTELVAAVTPDG